MKGVDHRLIRIVARRLREKATDRPDASCGRCTAVALLRHEILRSWRDEALHVTEKN